MKSVLGLKSLLISATVLTASLGSPSFSSAWSLASQPVEGILVLRNGNILRGKVQQLGEYYHVHIPNGELQVREQQVEMFCQDLEEAYQRRRETRGGSTADSHLELAGWCLRHDLFDHAKAELQAAESSDAEHPRLPLLRRHLKQVLQMAAAKERRELVEATPIPVPKPLDPASLEKAPQWARALFVRQIQPLVVHSCAAGGCHQSGTESAFQLNRLAIDGVGHPEATLRNLAATLQYIDWQAADQSDLLQRAKRAHGSEAASTPLPPHKLQVLQGWVEQLAEAHRKEVEVRTQPLLAEVEPVPATPTLQLLPPQQATPQPPGEVRTASFEPVDPFDPSVFNDRYATAKRLPVEQSVPHVLAPSEPELIPLPATE